MRKPLKVFAWLCKIAAIVFWLGVGCVTVSLDVSTLNAPNKWRDSPDWGTPEYHHRIYLEIAELAVLVALALLPNRWLVFRGWIFAMSLLVALSPYFDLTHPNPIHEWSDLIWVTFIMLMFSPLPLSLILSFWRQRKGEKIGYV